MKVLWAFEPFHQDQTRIHLMYQLLSQLAGSPQKIDLGFIITRAEPGMNLAFDVPLEQRYTTFPKEMTKLALKKAGVRLPDKNLLMIDYQTLSTTKAVDRLLKLARQRKSELVALYSHGRKGLERYVLGSFAETAIHRSHTHLLVVNPKMRLQDRVRSVLFATDFSRDSLRAIKPLLKICRTLKASLTLFHHHEAIYRWSLNEADREIQRMRKKTDQMQRDLETLCRRAGVAHQFIFSEAFRPTSEVILNLISKEKPNLVAVKGKSGAGAALLGGSVTRKIVRASSVPVMILK